jgi:hypothetical protein
MEEAVPFFRLLLRQHHAAMLAADVDTAMCLRQGAELLAQRQLASWGQAGEFTITVDTMQVRSELDGLFGIGSGRSFWPGFAAHAVDHDRPSLSETGCRSFLGIHADPAPRLTLDAFAPKVIAALPQERERRAMPVHSRPSPGQAARSGGGRAPDRIMIEGRAYSWKAILELCRAQLAEVVQHRWSRCSAAPSADAVRALLVPGATLGISGRLRTSPQGEGFDVHAEPRRLQRHRGPLGAAAAGRLPTARPVPGGGRRLGQVAAP